VSPDRRPAAEIILTGVPIHTFDSRGAIVEALRIADGTVVAAGELAEIERAATPTAASLQVDEGVIFPGFCDTHMHFEKIAAELQMLQLAEIESIEDLLQLLADAAATTPPGEWLQSFGDDNAWHEHQLQEQRLPTRDELDDAAPNHPVYLYRGWDAAALNSQAADALREALATDKGWHKASGHLYSPQARALQEQLPAPHDPIATLANASQQLLGLGITSIVDPGLPATFEATWDLYRACRDQSHVAQRLYLMDRLDHRRPFETELHRVKTAATERTTTHGGLHGWGLKLLVDGEFANAWMADGEPQPVPATRRYTISELEHALRVCAERGWPICFHTMGRGAAEAVLSAARKLHGTHAFTPNQITLAHAFLLSDQDMHDCAELGVGISVQPLLAYVFEREMLDAWGDLAHRANRYRLMLDHGVEVAGGSDVLPCEPLRGASVAVTRTSRHGSQFGRDQALTSAEAISLFTRRAGAYVQQPKLGTLEVGAPADFVCWPTNPLDRSPEDWPSLRPLFTAIGGETVWQHPAVSPPPLSPSAKGASAG
jgi:predicted amidohydrolase YtcJ